eukprot:4565516-Pleurochrysis_carterae.AAC.1
MAGLSTCQSVAAAVARAVQNQNGGALAKALQMDMGNSALLEQLVNTNPRLQQICAAALEVHLKHLCSRGFILLPKEVK